MKKIQRVILFNQKVWLKQHIELNTKLKTEAKNDFERNFFKLMNNSVFGKILENVREHWDIRLVTEDERRISLVSEPDYHTTKWM